MGTLSREHTRNAIAATVIAGSSPTTSLRAVTSNANTWDMFVRGSVYIWEDLLGFTIMGVDHSSIGPQHPPARRQLDKPSARVSPTRISFRLQALCRHSTRRERPARRNSVFPGHSPSPSIPFLAPNGTVNTCSSNGHCRPLHRTAEFHHRVCSCALLETLGLRSAEAP